MFRVSWSNSSNLEIPVGGIKGGAFIVTSKGMVILNDPPIFLALAEIPPVPSSLTFVWAIADKGIAAKKSIIENSPGFGGILTLSTTVQLLGESYL